MFAATDIPTRIEEARTGPGPLAHAQASRSPRAFRPDLSEDTLEDRLLPIVPNLGIIVLTTGGYILLTPFPGAYGSLSSPGSLSAAPSASGTPFNLPFFMVGGGGISSAIPGNITGYPSLGAAGPTGTTAGSGAGTVISVGSGANDVNAPVIPIVTRNTVANDVLNPPPLIGGRPDTASFLLPPAPAPPSPAVVAPPVSGAAAGPSMPPPGSSLSGPFVRFPSMFPRSVPLGFPMGSAGGPGPVGFPAPITPPPPPGGGQFGSAPPGGGSP